MKYLQSKTNKIVKLVVEWELVRSMLKFIVANTLLPFHVRQFAIISLSKLPLQSVLHRLKQRCTMSNQSRSVLSFFKLNRMRFKILASQGFLIGLKKNMY